MGQTSLFLKILLGNEVLLDGISEFLLGDLPELLRACLKRREALPYLLSLGGEGRLNLCPDLRLAATYLNQGLVAHNLLALRNLDIELMDDLALLLGAEVGESGLHLHLKVERALLSDEIEGGLLANPLVPDTGINLGHYLPLGGLLAASELNLQLLDPIGSALSVLCFDLTSQLEFALVTE